MKKQSFRSINLPAIIAFALSVCLLAYSLKYLAFLSDPLLNNYLKSLAIAPEKNTEEYHRLLENYADVLLRLRLYWIALMILSLGVSILVFARSGYSLVESLLAIAWPAIVFSSGILKFETAQFFDIIKPGFVSNCFPSGYLIINGAIFALAGLACCLLFKRFKIKKQPKTSYLLQE